MKYIVDTNVPIVANGQAAPDAQRAPSISCRLSSVQFLQKIIEHGRIVIDTGGEVRAEYHRYLNPRGQPGVGDRFYIEVINSHPNRVEFVSIEKQDSGEYADCPETLIEAGFDPSDRKFVALAMKSNGTVANAVDSDWIEHSAELERSGIKVDNLCGCDENNWFNP